MIKLTKILKENKKPVKEIVGMMALGAIIKKFIDKNPEMLDKVKSFVNKL